MLVRHVACASVWACAGQRHFVPRTYPGPPNPLSPPSSVPRRGAPAALAAAGVERGDPLTAHRIASFAHAAPPAGSQAPGAIPAPSLASLLATKWAGVIREVVSALVRLCSAYCFSVLPQNLPIESRKRPRRALAVAAPFGNGAPPPSSPKVSGRSGAQMERPERRDQLTWPV